MENNVANTIEEAVAIISSAFMVRGKGEVGGRRHHSMDRIGHHRRRRRRRRRRRIMVW